MAIESYFITHGFPNSYYVKPLSTINRHPGSPNPHCLGSVIMTTGVSVNAASTFC
jgi:hypothetical protein